MSLTSPVFSLLKCLRFPRPIFHVKLLELFCITKMYLICQIFIIYVCIIQFQLLLFSFLTFLIWSCCVFNAGECGWIICICKLQDLIHSDARTKLPFYSSPALFPLNLLISFLCCVFIWIKHSERVEIHYLDKSFFSAYLQLFGSKILIYFGTEHCAYKGCRNSWKQLESRSSQPVWISKIWINKYSKIK